MNLLEKTKEICRQNNIKPTRSKGQNFLINENVYLDIIKASKLQKEDVILEVGPGLGFLTRKLAQRVNKVIAVELDDKIAGILKKNLKKEGIKNVNVVNQDILNFNVKEEIKEPYRIIANLPYNISSIFLRKFLTLDKKPKDMILMLQKEVAQRIVAKPSKMSLLAVSVQFYAKAKIVRFVPSNAFWPQPKVDSAVIKIKLENGFQDKIKKESERDFFRLVKFGFSAKRKMLKNNLSGCYQIPQEKVIKIIKKAGLDTKVRAQELSIYDWNKLFESFK